MLSEKLSKPKSRKWCIIGTVVAIIVIIVIVVPLAVLLPKRNQKTHHASVLLPLYIYPENETTWAPLYTAIETHPKLQFCVVVNPNSGPGEDRVPASTYYTAIQKLNGYANVETVGYVRTTYGDRNISDVVADIKTYAGWVSNSSSIAMHGIFFDEAPHEYTAEAVTYMQEINKAVKNATGLQGDRTVIHNPGVVPDSQFNDDNTDITVVFEESYSTFQTRKAQVAALPDSSRTANSLMVHTVPKKSDSDMRKFVNQLSELGEWLYVTSNNVNYYQSFADDWAEFIDAIPTS